MQHLKPNEWQYYGLWRQDAFSASFWQSHGEPEHFHAYGFPADASSTIIANGGHFFYHLPTIHAVQNYLDALSGKERVKLLKRFADDAKKTYLESIAFAKKTADSAPLSIEYFREFLHHGRHMSFFWWLAAVHLAVAADRMFKKMAKDSKGVAPIIPHIQTPLFYQQRELWSLRRQLGGRTFSEARKDSKFMNALETHRKKYAWIETGNWIGKALTLERLLSLVQSATYVKTSGKVNPRMVSFERIGYAKQAGAEYAALYEYLMMAYLNRLAEHLNITYRDMMRLTHVEIEEVLCGAENNLKEIAKKKSRKLMRWIFTSGKDGSLCFSEDQRDVDVVTKMVEVPAFQSTIKGEIAYPGIVRGRACIVSNIDEFSKFEANDILVTTMTTPDFVILMQKAGAIVTDTGGVLSHAAIVSRELKKPCIIGTKIATKVLKDGDMVEVDGEKGVVKILKRAGDK